MSYYDTVGAGDIALEAGAVLVVGSPLGRVYRHTVFVSSHEDTVMMPGVLVEKPRLDKASDHLGRDAALLQVHEHAALIRAGWRQDKGRLFLGSVLN